MAPRTLAAITYLPFENGTIAVVAAAAALLLLDASDLRRMIAELSISRAEVVALAMGALFVAPLVETVLLVPLAALSRWFVRSSTFASLIVGLLFGCIHWNDELGALALPSAALWFVLFTYFAATYFAWRPYGLLRALAACTLVHVVANLVGACLLIAIALAAE